MATDGRAEAREDEWFDARRVARVLGAHPDRHDHGGTSEHDFDLALPDGRRIALEITSFGADHRLRFAGRLRQNVDLFAGHTLHWSWTVILDNAQAQIRELVPDLETFLGGLEAAGHPWARFPDDPGWVPSDAIELQIHSLGQRGFCEARASTKVSREGGPRIRVAQSEAIEVRESSLDEAILAVFAKGDNQEKLRLAESDERHLFIGLADWAAGAVLDRHHEPPPCPLDPADVIDCVWLYSVAASWAIFRASPGGRWDRFIEMSGEPRPYEPHL
jgi:hypothetical protein